MTQGTFSQGLCVFSCTHLGPAVREFTRNRAGRTLQAQRVVRGEAWGCEVLAPVTCCWEAILSLGPPWPLVAWGWSAQRALGRTSGPELACSWCGIEPWAGLPCF